MKKIQLIVTAKDTPYRMALLTDSDSILESTPDTYEKEVSSSKKIIKVKIDYKKKCQKIIGFGGAFTVSSSEAMKGVSEPIRKKAMEAYFDTEKGIGYNFCRTHMGSCDFSLENYSYNDTSGDINMDCFSVECDEKSILPMIKDAQMYREDLLLYSVPWSPPAWMKTNEEMSNGGKLKEEYKKAYALYFVKYLEEYQKRGVSIWGITPQNEPVEIQEWASCYYTAPEEADFIRNYLYPALYEHRLSDVKIMIWDSNKDQLYERVAEMSKDLFLKHHIFGAAFHWYSGDYFDKLDAVHKDFPSMNMVSTESCVVFPENLEDWSIGERYGHEIIGDMNHWTNGYIDWNLFLNEKGGPNLADNYCASPIILDSEKNDLIYLNSYYYIGHFSKYIQRNSIRLACETEEVEACAFLRPDNTLVTVIMNSSNLEVEIIVENGMEDINLKMLPHSIYTILLAE